MGAHSTVLALATTTGLGLLASPAHGQQPTPFPSALHPAPLDNPSGLVLADLDGDGRLDLAVSENPHGGGWQEPPSDVSVLLNAGWGRFHPSVSYPLGWHATGLAVGDLDGDGDLDLAVPHHESGGLMLLVGDGLGAFGTSSTVDAALHAQAVAIVDLDADGRLDLVAADADPLGVVAYRSAGAGSFGRPQRFPVPYPTALAAGDLDGDGAQDLVALDGNALWTLRGDGTGGFHAPTSRPVPLGLGRPALADLDGDGALDLAAGAGALGFLALSGDGSGGWMEARFVPARFPISGVVVADLDQDGNQDLAGLGAGRLVLRLGRGDGTFDPPSWCWAASMADQLAVGELDGDGRLDFAVTGWDALGVTVVAGCGRGELPRIEAFPVEPAAQRPEIGDLDGDGLPDLVLHGNADVLVHRGRGDGRFEPAQAYPFGGGYASTHPIGLADVDVDGRCDVVVAGDQGVEILRGQAGGTLGRAQLAVPTPRPVALALADLQGDGLPDLVVVEAAAVTPPQPAALLVALGAGAGAFGPTRRLDLPGWPLSVACGDLDADGRNDVALLVGEELWSLPGLGDGRLGPPRRVPIGPGLIRVALGPMDGDAALDVALAGRCLTVLHGDGAGGFLRTTRFPALPPSWASSPYSTAHGLRLADLDSDGDLDAVLDCGSIVSVLLDRGGGRLEPAQLLGPGPAFVTSALGDVDLDGDLDLVAVDDGLALGATWLNGTFSRH